MPIHADKFSELRFLLEPVSDADERRSDLSEWVDVGVGDGLRILDPATFSADPQLAAATRCGVLSTRALHFEQLSIDQRAALLMLTPPGLRVRVNDLPSPIVALLEMGDQLQVGATVLHLTRYREFAVGPPSSELLGRRCGVCRVPFDQQTRVYLHDCGEALHLEPESKPVEERLECARLGSCPNCEEPISLGSGYSFLPEL